MAGKFYVYRIFGEMGEIVYVGKGTGRRFEAQKRRFSSDGEIVRYFAKEDLAFRFEAKLIAKHNPPLNVVAGRGKGLLPVAAYRAPKPKDMSEEWFEMAARIIRTLKHYKQVNFFKTDIRGALERFVQAVAEKYGPEEFAARLLPYNIKVINN